MAWTQTDADLLKAAIAQGAVRVKFSDREVTYRSLGDMKETLRMIEADIAAALPTGKTRIRQVRFVTSSGLC